MLAVLCAKGPGWSAELKEKKEGCMGMGCGKHQCCVVAVVGVNDVTSTQ